MIEHYEFCIDILVIINADDKLLIKEMSKKASVHRNHPLLLSIRTSVHCTSSANNEKRKRQKRKKKDLFGYYQDYSIVCFFIVFSSKVQNVKTFDFSGLKKKFLSNVRSTACSTWRDSQYLVISKL